MMRLLIPVILLLLGTGGGIGAGMMLSSPAEEMSEDMAAEEGEAKPEGDKEEAAEEPAEEAEKEEPAEETDTAEEGEVAEFSYVKLNNQFVIPVLAEGFVSALVVMSLSLEVTTEASQSVYSIEPKLRDAFLQVMFDHANTGGFSGEFTMAERTQALRKALREAARKVAGKGVNDVLIIDMVRQDA